MISIDFPKLIIQKLLLRFNGCLSDCFIFISSCPLAGLTVEQNLFQISSIQTQICWFKSLSSFVLKKKTIPWFLFLPSYQLPTEKLFTANCLNRTCMSLIKCPIIYFPMSVGSASDSAAVKIRHCIEDDENAASFRESCRHETLSSYLSPLPGTFLLFNLRCLAVSLHHYQVIQVRNITLLSLAFFQVFCLWRTKRGRRK